MKTKTSKREKQLEARVAELRRALGQLGGQSLSLERRTGEAGTGAERGDVEELGLSSG